MKKNNIFKKIISFIMIITVSTYSLFGAVLPVSAEEEYLGVVTAQDGLNIRRAPNTDEMVNGEYNVITSIPYQSQVIVKSKYNSKWLYIKYGDIEGYVSASYVNSLNSDPYSRPWTTPKKAIVGGAKFISNSYINAGQFTSYLKKFNVNPSSSYNMYSHQYMANLAAPVNEAATTYNSYKNNGFLEMSFVFTIPVFNNMADSYKKPDGGSIDVASTDTIEDQNFENDLINKGFPESYRIILRVIHKAHPTWVFNALMTNANFDEAVNAEQNVSSIYYNTSSVNLEGGTCNQTESGWCYASTGATAYYLDPRNFLTEKYIFQFESLEFNESFNESLVQSVINNSFMSGSSSLDNQSFASIFVEAGRDANVSPVYLASLAIQESGREVKSTTSGAQFEYNGITYQGLYNFFNIGAYSSASNPAKAGLVYASGGFCTICSVDSAGYINNGTIATATSLANLGLTSAGTYVKGFKLGTTIADLKARDESVTYSKDNIITTGTTLTFSDGTSYQAVVKGDLNGDGEINSADLLKMRLDLIGSEKLTDAYSEAGELTNDSQINSADLLKMRQYLLEQVTLD